VNRLGVKWFETQSVSSSSETEGFTDIAKLRFAQSRKSYLPYDTFRTTGRLLRAGIFQS